ncbi:MAG: adenine deaminase, partial [Pseudomonadota bacterium]
MTFGTWQSSARRLIEVASGRGTADLVILGGTWVNVHSGELLLGTDVAIADGRFAYCGLDASAMIGPDTRIIDAEGRF